jgi:hypothetical protein
MRRKKRAIRKKRAAVRRPSWCDTANHQSRVSVAIIAFTLPPTRHAGPAVATHYAAYGSRTDAWITVPKSGKHRVTGVESNCKIKARRNAPNTV